MKMYIAHMVEVQFVRNYFYGEQNESIAFLLIGLLSILFGIGLIVYYKDRLIEQRLLLGVSIVLIAIGFIEVSTGTTIYFRSPDDIERVETMLEEEGRIEAEEIPRMEAVLQSFVVYRYIEISLGILGIVAFLALRKFPLVRGMGLGFFLKCAILLFLDTLAESRGDKYLSQLMEMISQ